MPSPLRFVALRFAGRRSWLFSSALLILAGCSTFVPASPDRLTSDPALAPELFPAEWWPSRDTSLLDELVTQAMRHPRARVRVVDGAIESHYRGVSSSSEETPPQIEFLEAWAGDQGWFLRASLEGEERPVSLFFSYLRRFTARRDLERFSSPDSDGFVRWEPIDQLRPVVKLELPSEGVSRRGTVIMLHGIASASLDRPLVDTLKKRGWVIVSCDVSIFACALPFFDRSDRHAMEDAATTLSENDRAQRDVRRLLEGYEERRDPEYLGKMADHVLAEVVYAVEAFLERYYEWYPSLEESPRVVIGTSLGALTAPALMARLGSVTAGVLLVGGADLLQICSRTSLEVFRTDAGEIPIFLRQPEFVDKPRVTERFRAASRLDPFTTARWLRTVPILSIHSTDDVVVPSENGDLLWERLGRPDRLQSGWGHTAQVFFTRFRKGWIADWIDEHAGPAEP